MYSAIELDEKSQLALSAWADKNIKVNGVRLPALIGDSGWKLYCRHMTIYHPKVKKEHLSTKFINKFSDDKGMLPKPSFIQNYLGEDETLEVTHFGVTDKVIAVRVNTSIESVNKYPHVTVAVNLNNGGRPDMSNDIKTWTSVKGGPKLKGIVEELN